MAPLTRLSQKRKRQDDEDDEGEGPAPPHRARRSSSPLRLPTEEEYSVSDAGASPAASDASVKAQDGSSEGSVLL